MAKDRTIPQDDVVATRERLLQAAGEVFGENGFRAATIRDICRRAGANVAAVNYHFRDKEELYLAVFKTALCAPETSWHGVMESLQGAGPWARLEMFIRGMLTKLLSPGRPAWQGKMIAREMLDPTSALDVVVEQAMGPQFAMLRSIVAELLGASPTDERVRYAGASVIGQCLFYRNCEPVVRRLYPTLTYDAREIERIGTHILAFSRGAILELKRSAKKRGTGK